jgi:alkanesulfonate monooxygenase SsuD/methylene tetrahydromethanopterin reductase-like flavin-dependent oxidoreductase (luciferase family)
MKNQTVYPRAKNGGKLPIWRAVGGTPQSVLSAAKLGMPLVVAIIGGMPIQFKNLIDFYKQEYLKAGHSESEMQIAIHSHTFVSEDQEVIDGYFHNYKSQMDRIGSARGWAPYSKMQYEGGRSKDGALFIGNTNEVADKITYMKEIFGITRFIGHMDVGAPEDDIMRKSIELFGEKVGPQVK